jgi:hypothetical protein
MSLTIIGALIVPIAFICTIFLPAYLLPLLVISSVFQAASIANGQIGDYEFGLPPFYFVAICIAFRYLLLRLWGGNAPSSRNASVDKITVPLIAFWVWSLVSSFIMPRLFNGMPVYSPRVGIDDQFINQTPLYWSASNLAQAAYLTLDIVVILFALRTVSNGKQVGRLIKSFYVAILTVVVVGFWQHVASVQQWWFPFDAFDSNPGQIQAVTNITGFWQRMTSTFSEPSYAGAFLAAATSGLIASFIGGKRSLTQILPLICVFLALLDTASTTGYAAVAITVCLMVVFLRAASQKEHSARGTEIKGWIAIGAAVGVSALILFANSDLLEAAAANTLYKTEGVSLLHRIAADSYALGLVKQTYGLGVGLGSNRPSSLATALLSTVGIPGTLLFIAVLYWIFKAFSHVPQKNLFQIAFWALAGLLVAQILAVPDITFSVLWTLIMLTVVQLNAVVQDASTGPRASRVRGTALEPGESC